MLQLHPHQLDGFALDAEQRFERQLLEAVAERLAGPDDPPVPAARLQALVREGLALAERLGMFHEAHVAQVTMLHAASRCRALVPDLLSPWAQEALQRPASTPTTRLGWIRARLAAVRDEDGRGAEGAARLPPGSWGRAARRLAEDLAALHEAFA